MVKQKNAQTTFVHKSFKILPTDLKVSTKHMALLRAKHLQLVTETFLRFSLLA